MIAHLLLVLLTSAAWASPTTFVVRGVGGQALLEVQLPPAQGTLGQATHEALEASLASGKLAQYQGSSAGIQSVEGLGGALEVLSDTRMNAYGWCYRVDGVLSSLLADQYVLDGTEKRVEWFYAYAHLDKTEWTSFCVPADHLPEQE